MISLFRKRLIPSECIHLANDKIMYHDNSRIITKWNTLHPKQEFSHGASFYCLNEGWKISKFYHEDNSLAYIYCDIIDTSYDESTQSYIFTDLLADIIIENNGFVRVVDLDELADACSMQIISTEMLAIALHRLNNLLELIYHDGFQSYIDELNSYENSEY